MTAAGACCTASRFPELTDRSGAGRSPTSAGVPGGRPRLCRLAQPNRGPNLAVCPNGLRPARSPPAGPPGRCSFAIPRGSPVSNTLPKRRGAAQGSSGVPTTRGTDAHSRGTAPICARRRAICASLAGTAQRARSLSACRPTAWRRGGRQPSTRWKRSPPKPNTRGA